MSIKDKVLGTAVLVGGGLLALKVGKPQVFTQLMTQFKAGLFGMSSQAKSALTAASAKGTEKLGLLHYSNPEKYERLYRAAKALHLRPEDLMKLAKRLPEVTKQLPAAAKALPAGSAAKALPAGSAAKALTAGSAPKALTAAK